MFGFAPHARCVLTCSAAGARRGQGCVVVSRALPGPWISFLDVHWVQFDDGTTMAVTRNNLEADVRPLADLRTLAARPSAAAASADRLRLLVRLHLRDAGLEALPATITQCSALSRLDVSGNALRDLPPLDGLQALRTLIADRNRLAPALAPGKAVSRAKSLRTLAVDGNGIEGPLDARGLPKAIVSLSAADNAIDALPHFGRLSSLRKLVLSNNALTEEGLKPAAVVDTLEELRVASNRLRSVPAALLEHPTLAWLSLGGNPCADEPLRNYAAAEPLPTVAWSALEVAGERVAASDGSHVRRAVWAKANGAAAHVAVKTWRGGGAVADGTAPGALLVAGLITGPCLHKAFATTVGTAGDALVVEDLPGAVAVGCPPTFETVTRATFRGDGKLSPGAALTICGSVIDALQWLHARDIMHGGISMHNILACEGSAVRLCGYGMASAYDRKAVGDWLEIIETRAFACLMEDCCTCLDGPTKAVEDCRRTLLDAVQYIRAGDGNSGNSGKLHPFTPLKKWFDELRQAASDAHKQAALQETLHGAVAAGMREREAMSEEGGGGARTSSSASGGSSPSSAAAGEAAAYVDDVDLDGV